MRRDEDEDSTARGGAFSTGDAFPQLQSKRLFCENGFGVGRLRSLLLPENIPLSMVESTSCIKIKNYSAMCALVSSINHWKTAMQIASTEDGVKGVPILVSQWTRLFSALMRSRVAGS